MNKVLSKGFNVIFAPILMYSIKLLHDLLFHLIAPAPLLDSEGVREAFVAPHKFLDKKRGENRIGKYLLINWLDFNRVSRWPINFIVKNLQCFLFCNR